MSTPPREVPSSDGRPAPVEAAGAEPPAAPVEPPEPNPWAELVELGVICPPL